MSEATTHLRQVVGYVQQELKDELSQMKAANRRLSESAIIERAFEIALPELRREFLPPFKSPTHGRPGRRPSKAA